MVIQVVIKIGKTNEDEDGDYEPSDAWRRGKVSV